MHTFKRTLAVLLAVMLMVGMLSAIPASADEVSFTAGMGLVASDWSTNTNFGADSAVTTTITGDGTYTMTYTGACLDLGILVVDIVGAQTALSAEGKTYKVSNVKLVIDGNEIAVDGSKIVAGDLENNGNFRIELHNMYGSTASNPALDNTTTVAESLELTFTLTTVIPGTYTAGMGLVASDWSTNINFGADSAVTTTVTGDGTYTMTYTGACLDLGILVVDIVGAQAELNAENKTYAVSDVKLVIDGNEIAVDGSKIVVGDLENNGNFRIELHNMYGSTASNPALDNTTTVAESLELTFTLATVDKPSEGGDDPVDPPAPIPEFDPAGSYNAYLGMQTPNWSYRDEWNSANGIGSEVWGDFINGGAEGKFGKVTDAVVAGNGTYTVSVTDVGTVIGDDFTAAGQEYFNLLYISTDIPKTADVTVTDVKLIIDGKTVYTYDEAYLDPDVDEYVKILIQNVWNEDVAELSYYAAPKKSVEMQFTISGFSYDAAVSDPDPDPTNPPATNPPAAQPGDENPDNSILPIIIGVVAVVAVAVVVVVVLKKKKN